MRRLWKIIPRQYRHRTLWVAVSIFLRAFLNFVGIATLIPIITLILDSDALATNSYFAKIYEILNVDNYSSFVCIMCCAIITIILIKNGAILLLSRVEHNYIYALYLHLSKRLLLAYYNRGYEYIKHNNSAILTRNVNVVSLMFVAGVLKPIATIVGELLLFLLIMVAIAWYTPLVSLFTIALFVPIITLFYLTMRRRLHDIGELENREQRTKSRIISDCFRGYADIETSDAFPLIFSRFERTVNEIARLRKLNATIGQIPQMLAEVGIAIGLVTLVIIGLIYNDGDSAIAFGIYAVATVRMIPTVRGIMTNWGTIRYNRHSIEKILDTEEYDARDIKHSCERLPFHSAIELDNISFTFSDATSPTLENISLTIHKGERLGIQGSSGIGKTTLFNIILGLYNPTSGKITVDGTQLTNESIRKWQNTVGYVSQSVFIVDGSVAENIALGYDKSEIDHKLMMRAIEYAELKEFIDTLPNGIATQIGEQGSRLSGGQRQRIGIARALYKGCDILLFDEATSSLDNHTEQNINQAIARLSTENRDLTIVVIAHRDSSLEYCDRIITLQ